MSSELWKKSRRLGYFFSVAETGGFFMTIADRGTNYEWCSGGLLVWNADDKTKFLFVSNDEIGEKL